MLVLCGVPYLIVVARLSEKSLFNQTQFQKKSQASVNSRQADGCIGAAGTPVQFLGVNMPIGITNQLQEQLSLRCEGITGYLVSVIANVSHSQLLS
jgi:hypothetical protein